MSHVLPTDFRVIELRRYAVVEAERETFARYFESYFPEAFQQLGALVIGHFFERADRSRFTWIRGFPDMETRLAVNEAFYDGPLWREHSSRMNDRLIDHTDVLLLRPLEPSRGVAILPAVDPLHGPARGVAALAIVPARPGRVEELAGAAEEMFAGWRGAGMREAGALVTLDVPNNFPRHPVRSDGPYLVWLGIGPDEEALARFAPAAARSLASLPADLVRGEAQLLLLDPAARSRLRWLA